MKHDFPPILLTLADRMTSSALTFGCTLQAWIVFALLGARVGRHLRVHGRLIARARRRNSLVLGSHITFTSTHTANLAGLTGPCILDTLGGGTITIGDHSGGSSVVMSSRSSIRIGKWVKLGSNVRIYDHDFHAPEATARRTYSTDQSAIKTVPIELGDDVFVGANAILLKGTRLGDRTIVGAGAVVAGLQAPPDSRIIGNPARIIQQSNP